MTLALQHVLAMYAGAVTVPIIVGTALKFADDQIAYLISSDLLACGIITIIQCIGIGGIGVRLPVMMGVTFVAIGPAISIAANPDLGLPGVFGATMISGVIGLFIAPIFSRLSFLFAPVVTGTAMLLIGLSLLGPAINWASGGGADGSGDMPSIGIALLVISTILATARFGGGFLSNTAVLVGIVFGYMLTYMLGWITYTKVIEADWFAVVEPLHFGPPRFDIAAILSMIIVMLVTMVESSGMMFALGRIVEEPLTEKSLARGLRADALGALIGGLFNSLPYTSFSQNVAMVSMTGIRSRFVCATAGVFLIGLACIPKLSFLVTSIPLPVLGGAALVMFSMVAANGIETLSHANLGRNRQNLYVVALALAVGMIPTLNKGFFDHLPPSISTFLHNGVLLGILTAIILNLVLNAGSTNRTNAH
jgi:NCS2 family nucleobase:cation symporter-2